MRIESVYHRNLNCNETIRNVVGQPLRLRFRAKKRKAHKIGLLTKNERDVDCSRSKKIRKYFQDQYFTKIVRQSKDNYNQVRFNRNRVRDYQQFDFKAY